MYVASVIVDVSARSLNRAFDYIVPDELQNVEIGCAVSVEFGARPVVGYIVALEHKATSEYDLKPLLGVLSNSYFDEIAARCAFWIANEYMSPLVDAFNLFTPPGGHPHMKRIDGKWQLVYPGVSAIDDRWVFLQEAAESYQPAKNASRQQAILRALSCGGMRAAELSIELGAISSALKALEERGVIRIEHRRKFREISTCNINPSNDIKMLTAGQLEALKAIEKSFETKATVLVDGITGSGKTEVYLRAISKVLEMGKSACVLVPEIALTPQTVGRFRSRFGADVAVLHSRLSVGERFDQWDIVHSGAAHVVVGTRSALFAPLKNLGLIIIDEEHESTYKQESNPRYNAVSVARKIASLRGATLVLGSATPNISTLSHCDKSLYGTQTDVRVELNERPNGKPLPSVQIVDMSAEFEEGSRSMFSEELQNALMEVHEAGQKAVLLLNKRGFASFVLCRECGFVPQCPDCSVSLTYHEIGNKLVCHHCGFEKHYISECPECKSPYLRKFGTGTQRVEEELRAILPDDMQIVRMDADTTKGKGKHAQLLQDFAAAKCAVLLGTQMIAKGLDFPDVSLVGVINADTALNLPDFRAGERAFQLIEQVAGRAGRAGMSGRVIVQTYQPRHPAILAAAKHDRLIMVKPELASRKELHYPPYWRLANVLIWGKNEKEVQARATRLHLAISSAVESAGGCCVESAGETGQGSLFDTTKDEAAKDEPCSESQFWEILPASPCVFERLNKNYRWHILIKAPLGTNFASVLAPVLSKPHKHKDVYATVDVDPVSLL